jgi:hypothetical protein
LNRVRPASVAVAAGVAALTVMTFALLRDTGPRAAVTRFHRAVLVNDESAVLAVTSAESPDELGLLARLVRRFMGPAGEFRILAVGNPSPTTQEQTVMVQYPPTPVEPARFYIFYLRRGQDGRARILVRTTLQGGTLNVFSEPGGRP